MAELRRTGAGEALDKVAESAGRARSSIAAIAGGLAEVIYPIPPEIREEVLLRLDRPMVEELEKCVDFFFRRLQT